MAVLVAFGLGGLVGIQVFRVVVVLFLEGVMKLSGFGLVKSLLFASLQELGHDLSDSLGLFRFLNGGIHVSGCAFCMGFERLLVEKAQGGSSVHIVTS